MEEENKENLQENIQTNEDEQLVIDRTPTRDKIDHNDIVDEIENSFGGMLVAIPTAIPVVPLTKIFGNLDGRTLGSCSRPSKLSSKSTVFLFISRSISLQEQ